MMNRADRVAASSARALIEELLIAQKKPEEIAILVAEKTGQAFVPEDIKEYQKQYMLTGRSLVSECIGVSKNLAKMEIPASSDADQLAQFFSFKSTNDDLEMIYGRIRELRASAAGATGAEKADDTYDARIVKYLETAEKIRGRVIKNQFENLRKSILLNMGKKMAMAAINSFMPYIQTIKKDEAKNKFLKAIEPLINSELAPPVPDDIQEVEREVNNG